MTIVFQAIINGLLTGGIYSLVGVGLSLVLGVMNIANFSHGAFLMLGMYFTYFLFTLGGIDPYIGSVITIVALFLVGVLVQKLTINPILDAPHGAQLLVTMGIMVFLENFALFAWNPDLRLLQVRYGAAAFSLGGVMVNFTKVMAFGIAILLTLCLFIFLKKTELGKAIRAAADNREGAVLLGINVKRIFLVTFGLGCACAGAAGSIITPFFYIAPTVGHVYLLVAFVIVVLGGMGNFWGAFFSGLIIGLTESLGTIFVSGSLKQVLSYGVFILVLFFKPSGIMGSGK